VNIKGVESCAQLIACATISLLHFDNHRYDDVIHHNLKTLYQLENLPSDTYMRERLDPIDPQMIRPAFKALFRKMQRGKVLESYVFMNGRYLLPLDGTGVFSSHQVHCKKLLRKTSRKWFLDLSSSNPFGSLG
jgi:hypothetical protein